MAAAVTLAGQHTGQLLTRKLSLAGHVDLADAQSRMTVTDAPAGPVVRLDTEGLPAAAAQRLA